MPDGFTEDMILKAPSKNIMNKIARSVLAAYSYDPNPDEISAGNILRQSIELIARLPVMAAYGYQAKAIIMTETVSISILRRSNFLQPKIFCICLEMIISTPERKQKCLMCCL